MLTSKFITALLVIVNLLICSANVVEAQTLKDPPQKKTNKKFATPVNGLALSLKASNLKVWINDSTIRRCPGAFVERREPCVLRNRDPQTEPAHS